MLPHPNLVSQFSDWGSAPVQDLTLIKLVYLSVNCLYNHCYGTLHQLLGGMKQM